MIARLARYEPVRYLGGGAVSAALNFAVLVAGDAAGLGYPALMGLTWLIGGSAGYVMHVRFTFRASAGLWSYARFMAGVALGVPLGLAVLWGFHSWLGWPMWLAAPAQTLVLLVYNYLAARLAILWRGWRGSGRHAAGDQPQGRGPAA